MIQSNSQKTTILAIDSTTGPCSVAVWQGGAVVSYREELASSKQSARLMSMVEEVLAEAGVSYAQLGSIAVTVGPGSFTGIRIALAAARGIGFAANLPVLGFSALNVLAYGAHAEQKKLPIIAVLNAGKGEVVYQHYTPDFIAMGEPILNNAEALIAHLSTPTLLSGFTLADHAMLQAANIPFPRADTLAMLAANHPQLACEPLPYYVRPPDAKIAGA